MSFTFVDEHVIRPFAWTGENPSWEKTYIVRNLAIIIFGTAWAFVFALFYAIIHRLSKQFFAKYNTLNNIQQTDWTSRIVAMFFITGSSTLAYIIFMGDTNHRLIPEGVKGDSSFENSRWRFTTEVYPDTLYILFHYYVLAFGYELYDLKNCWDIKMYSGVLHHLVLLVIFPLGWSATSMSIPAACMVSSTYLSNIPAHFRSFMVVLGYRDSPAYKANKWAWWLSYVVFRLFGIPWFSSVMWFSIDPMRLQVPLFAIAWYFSAMTCHYALSLYWFVEMTKTMFPPDKQLKRVGSYPVFPQDPKKAAEKIAYAETSSDSEDEGGQKFE